MPPESAPRNPGDAGSDDARFMAAAVALGRRGLGRVWPNPAVGCVLVRDGRIAGTGWTRPGGRPHAETEALAVAGAAARGATAYVTLEPCAHVGVTGSCARALIDAGVVRVVAALRDPDPRVSGRGFGMLRAAGVVVTTGVGATAARDLTAGFLSRITAGRPLVTAKIATSLDGRLATVTGHSQWITGPAARRAGHGLRARHDAILVGAGTVRADDPGLDVRLPGLADRSPVRVVLTSDLALPPDGRLLRTAADRPLWLLTLAGQADGAAAAALRARGADIIGLPAGPDGRPDLAAGLQALGRRGITRLMVEGGGGVMAALARADLIDRWAWFRAGLTIGGDGMAAVAPIGLLRLDGAVRFTLSQRGQFGDDVLETWTRAA